MTGSVGLMTAATALIFLRLQRRRAIDELSRVRDKMSENLREQESACLEKIAELKRDFITLELSMQATQEVLGDGRLSRSGRAQAMRLLRSGVSPETAASTLGVARNEMRLLAKVSEILNAPS